MAAEMNVKIAKWLIKKGYLDAALAKKVIKKLKEMEEKGKRVSILTLLEKKALLKPDQLKEAKALLKKTSAKKGDVVKTSPKKQAKPSEKAKPAKRVLNANEEDLSLDLEENYSLVEKYLERDEDEDEENTLYTEVTEVTDATDVSESNTVLMQGRERCRECHSDIPIGSRDCPICGARIPRRVIVECVSCGHEVNRKAKYCAHCGCEPLSGVSGPNTARCPSCSKSVMPDDAVCIYCGFRQPSVGAKGAGFARYLVLLLALLTLGATSIAPSINRNVVPEKIPILLPYEDVRPADLQLTDTPPMMDEFWEEIRKTIRKGDWKALQDLMGIQEAYDLTQVQLWALAAFRLKNYQQAIALSKVYDQDEFLVQLHAEVLFREAIQFLEKGDLKLAELALDEVQVMRGEDDLEVAFWLGVVYWQKGEIDRAEEIFMASSDYPYSLLMLSLINRAEAPASAEAYLKQFENRVEKAKPFLQLLEGLP